MKEITGLIYIITFSIMLVFSFIGKVELADILRALCLIGILISVFYINLTNK